MNDPTAHVTGRLDGFPSEPERLELMHAAYDPITWRHLDRLGPLRGLRVLDAGSGRGALTRALWERIGPDGLLLAVDKNPAHLADHGEVPYQRRTLDLRDLGGLERSFDLVFSRLVLDHVPERNAVVRLLADRLAASGTIFLEDLDLGPAMADGVPGDYVSVVLAYHRWCLAHGYDYRWIRTVPELLEDRGLADVEIAEEVTWFRCGSPYARMFGATLAVHRHEMAEWIDPAEVERVYRWLQSGAGWLPGPSVWSVWARRRSPDGYGPSAGKGA